MNKVVLIDEDVLRQLMTKSEHMSFHMNKRLEEKKKGGMTYQ